MAVPSKRTAALTLAFVAALGLWLALSGRRPPAGSPKPQLLYSAIAVASAAVAPPGCTASPSVCGDTLVCGGRWFVWQEGARSETECTRALGELLYGVDQLAAAPMAAAQSEPCSHAIALAKQSRPSWSGCTQHFTTYIPVYQDVLRQVEAEERSIAERRLVRVEPSSVTFSCPDETWAFFADVEGFVETFSPPYRGLWRHADGVTTKIYQIPRASEGYPAGLWNVGDLDGNDSDEFVLLEAGRYAIVDVRDGERRLLHEGAAPAEPMRYEYGQDEVLLALGDTFYAYRDGAVISAPTEGIAAFEKREAQLHASLAQLRAGVMAPIHMVSDRCDLVRAGWSRSLTGLVGWSRPAASYDTVAMAVRHLAEHIVCDDPRGARLDGGGGRDDARPW